jgi:hypothetical protein
VYVGVNVTLDAAVSVELVVVTVPGKSIPCSENKLFFKANKVT